MNAKKKEKKVFDGINLNNSIEVIKRLKQFRTDGKPDQLSEIIAMMQGTSEEEVSNVIIQILNDLKDKSAIPYLVKEIEKESNRDIQHHLVSACWQNGLEYSPYFSFFIQIMVEGSYLTALETFSVLEVMDAKIDEQKLDESIAILKNAMPDFEEDKQFLVKELIHHLHTKKMAG